jgi:hypothetical protein
MALFKRIADKEFTVEERERIERLCDLAKTTVDGAMAETFLYLPEQYRIRRAESVIFRETIDSHGSLNLYFFDLDLDSSLHFKRSIIARNEMPI